MPPAYSQPDALGHWGKYGGRFVPETLMAPLEELTEAYLAARDDQSFQAELRAAAKLCRHDHTSVLCVAFN